MMNRSNGLSLVELLVALAILGILLVPVFQLVTGGLRFSSAATTRANLLEEVNDASGYLADIARQAAAIVSGSGAQCSASPSSTEVECVALIVPSVSSGSSAIDEYWEYEYVRIPRSEVPLAQKLADDWADSGSNAWAVVEYRRQLCPSGSVTDCSDFELPAPSLGVISGDNGPFLLVDYLSPASSITADSTSSVFEIELQATARERGEVKVVPEDPIELRIGLRNVQ